MSETNENERWRKCVTSQEKRSPTQVSIYAIYLNGVKIGGPGVITVQHDAEQSTPEHKPAHRDESVPE